MISKILLLFVFSAPLLAIEKPIDTPLTEEQILKKELELNKTLIVGEKVEVNNSFDGEEPRVVIDNTLQNLEENQEQIRQELENTEEEALGETNEVPSPALVNQLSMDIKEDNSDQKFYGVDFRYLGVLTQVGFEARIYRQFSMGVHYGRYNGKVAGSDKLGMVPDLQQIAIGFNAYLGKERIAFTNGLIVRFGLHYNQQAANSLVQAVQVNGEDVIRPGESKIGTQMGIGYHYQFKNLFANAGIEYITLGALKNLVPIAVTVGVAF